MRAAFMGSPEFAVASLHAVAEVCDLRVVVSQPDRPAGRGRKLVAPAVKEAALVLGVPVLQPTKVRDGSLAAELRRHALDVIVVTAYGRILPREILELPRFGCINVHASLLPRWRGAAPIQRAVLAGDGETGVAIMRMEEGLDTGPIYRELVTPIGPLETSGELFERLVEQDLTGLVERGVQLRERVGQLLASAGLEPLVGEGVTQVSVRPQQLGTTRLTSHAEQAEVVGVPREREPLVDPPAVDRHQGSLRVGGHWRRQPCRQQHSEVSEISSLGKRRMS